VRHASFAVQAHEADLEARSLEPHLVTIAAGGSINWSSPTCAIGSLPKARSQHLISRASICEPGVRPRTGEVWPSRLSDTRRPSSEPSRADRQHRERTTSPRWDCERRWWPDAGPCSRRSPLWTGYWPLESVI